MVGKAHHKKTSEIHIAPILVCSRTAAYLHIGQPHLPVHLFQPHIHGQACVAQAAERIGLTHKTTAYVMIHLDFTYGVVRQVSQSHHHIAVKKLTTVYKQLRYKLTIHRNASVLVELCPRQIANQVIEHRTGSQLQIGHIVLQRVAPHHHLQPRSRDTCLAQLFGHDAAVNQYPVQLIPMILTIFFTLQVLFIGKVNSHHNGVIPFLFNLDDDSTQQRYIYITVVYFTDSIYISYTVPYIIAQQCSTVCLINRNLQPILINESFTRIKIAHIKGTYLQISIRNDNLGIQ